MGYVRELRKNRLFRFYEILPGASAWVILIGLFILCFIHPQAAAIFIICFDVYWLIKISYLSIYLTHSHKILQKNIKTNWLSKCKKLSRFKDIYHLIILPTYREKLDIIKPTFQALLKSQYPKDKMIVVLATEERDRENAKKISRIIQNQFGNKFYHFMITVHPKDIVGEIAGKGSNETWAAKQALKFIDQEKIPYHNVIVSVLDIDTCVHPQYLASLTWHYLNTKNPDKASYQPVPMYFNNIWDSPALMRVIAFNTTFWQMMQQGRPESLCTFSSHAMSLKTLVDIGFWHTDVVSEDSHIFWQCFIHYKGDYRVIPLLMPVYMDTVLADTLRQSIINQYKQQRRWAYGAENIPYVFYEFTKDKIIPLSKKLVQGFMLFDGSLSWATNALILFFLGWLPLIVKKEAYQTTVLAQSLPFIVQILMTLAMIGLFTSATLSLLILPPRPKKYKLTANLGMLLQWILLPLSTIILGSIPALDAQTRLMIGKYMGFWVTEKARKRE